MLNDWEEERLKMINVMKLAYDTLLPRNYDSYNADMVRNKLKTIITSKRNNEPN